MTNTNKLRISKMKRLNRIMRFCKTCYIRLVVMGVLFVGIGLRGTAYGWQEAPPCLSEALDDALCMRDISEAIKLN